MLRLYTLITHHSKFNELTEKVIRHSIENGYNHNCFYTRFDSSTDFDLKKTYSSRFFRYYYAMVEGKRSAGQQPADASATCRQLYGLCPYDVEHTINMNVLRIMQFISRKFRIQFADTSL